MMKFWQILRYHFLDPLLWEMGGNYYLFQANEFTRLVDIELRAYETQRQHEWF